MAHIIALTGFKQTGKSTAASYLTKNYGFVRHNFKDALIKELEENFPDLLNYFLELYEADTFEELWTKKPEGVRRLMQNYGTEVRRKDCVDYWVRRWEETLPPGDVVIDDCRFVNEAQTVKNLNGIIIRLKRTDITTGGDHISEVEQASIVPDYIIGCGSGEHYKLYKSLDEIMKVVKYWGVYGGKP